MSKERRKERGNQKKERTKERREKKIRNTKLNKCNIKKKNKE